MKKTCEYCHKVFTTQDRRQTFCSRQCYENQHTSLKSFICEQCSATFQSNDNGWRANRFCCMACYTTYRRSHSKKKLRHFKCAYCGKRASVNDIDYYAEQRFCSLRCSARYRFEYKNDKCTYGPNWHGQRLKARARDKNSCKKCGKKTGRLHVHHIVEFREFGIERYKEANDLSNLVTLCPRCHHHTHFG